MKRIICAITALLLVLSMVPALAAPGDAVIYDQELNGDDFYVGNYAWYEGVMYMSDYGQNLYTWTSESGEIKTWPLPQDLIEMDPDEGYFSLNCMVSGDDGVYFIYEVYEMEDEYNVFKHMQVFKPTINGEELVFDTEPYELEWEDLVEEYDGYSFANRLSNGFVQEGKLIGTSWTDSGNYAVVVIDIEDDDTELYEIENEVSIYGLTPYKDNKALIVTKGYENENDPSVISAVDLETGEYETLVEIVSENWTYPSHLAYDAANDYLYYVFNGELCRMKGMDYSTAESVAALNMDTWSENPSYVTADGAYYITGDYSSIVMRNTDPSQRAAKSITVHTSYTSAMERAETDFAANNPDCEVIIANTYEEITQAMMNQSSAIDIYTVYVNDQNYAAVFERGYMAELDSSEVITGFVNSVYPSFREMMTRDGHVVAIPVEMWSNSYSYNPVAFEKLGLTEDDVPTCWDELLDLAIRLPEIWGDNEEGYTLFDPYYTVDDIRYMLFYEIVDDYLMYLQQDGVEFAFDTPLLRGLIEKLNSIDFAALGFMEEYSEDEEMAYEWNEEKILFQTYADVSSRVYGLNNEYSQPMPLAMEKGGRQTISANLCVAFVNPYSDDKESAIKYLESAVRGVDHAFHVDISPEFNEPLENAYYEENIAAFDETIASWNEQLESTEDEEERAMIEQSMLDYTEYMEEYKAENRYDISAESIEYYRGFAEYIVPIGFTGFDEEASNEYYDQLNQYVEGAIDLDTFLKNVDSKLRMMMLENQ